MDQQPHDADGLARDFEQHRTHLRAVAYRMLGTVHEADDAVQETWLRLARTDVSDVANLGGWLTTVASRISLDHLRTRGTRREEPLDDHVPEAVASETEGHPEHEAVLADSVGQALLVVLETLSPAERLAFVLHDLFALPFDEVSTIMGRSPVAVRQLASRGRRRVQVPEEAEREHDRDRLEQRRIVDAFLTASKGGDLRGLLDLLDPGALVRADPAAVRMGTAARVEGAAAVAEFFDGRARAARTILLDGYASAVWSLRGVPQVVFAFTVDGGRVVEIELLADPEVVPGLDLARAPKGG